MPPIKILRIITRLNVGGASRHVALLTGGLNGGRFTSKLVAGRVDDHEGDMSFLASDYGLSVIQVDDMSNASGIMGNLRSLLKLYLIICEERPDIVDLHLLKARFLGGLAAKLARVPVIIETFHGHLFNGYYGKLKTAGILAAERFLGWMILDRIIAISEGQGEELLGYRICPSRKIEVVPLGLELPRLDHCSNVRGKLREELGLAESTLLVGIVGRLVPIKGFTYLLEAVSRITRSEGHDFCLLVVGDGSLREQLEEQSRRLGIEDKIRFLGWRFDLEKIYSDLDIVVLSSLNEGTPLSLIEAMAAGKAVVATKVGGVPDVVEHGETGLLAPPKDPAALAAAILCLLKDEKLRKRLGEKAQTSVLSKYDKSRLLKDMEEFYLRLVAEMN